MAFKHATDKQLLEMSVMEAFERLRSEGKTFDGAVDRMYTITKCSQQQLVHVASIVYHGVVQS